MRTRFLWPVLLAVCSASLLAGCTGEDVSARQKISPEDLKAREDAGKPGKHGGGALVPAYDPLPPADLKGNKDLTFGSKANK